MIANPKADLHNRISREMIMTLREALDDGATFEEVMVIGESVIMGITLLIKELGGDKVVVEKTLQIMFEGAKQRLSETRVSPIVRPH